MLPFAVAAFVFPVAGNPSIVLSMCRDYWDGSAISNLPASLRKSILAMHQQWSLVSCSTHYVTAFSPRITGMMYAVPARCEANNRFSYPRRHARAHDVCQEMPGNTPLTVASTGVNCFDGIRRSNGVANSCIISSE